MLPERDRLSTASAIAGRGGISSGCSGARFPVVVDGRPAGRLSGKVNNPLHLISGRKLFLAIANERAGGAAPVRFR
jgi:hypothetical protein